MGCCSSSSSSTAVTPATDAVASQSPHHATTYPYGAPGQPEEPNRFDAAAAAAAAAAPDPTPAAAPAAVDLAPAAAAAEAEAPVAKLRDISEAELRKHDAAHPPLWVAIHGHVYDITAFAPTHPGGDVIVSAAGTDGTDQFELFGHTTEARNRMKQYLIGRLVK